jgi:pyruvate/2-oxoacid:ferredoxin oxidoreductase beta subunit
MTTLKEYMGQVPAWCPGCGNFAIRRVVAEALIELELEPHQVEGKLPSSPITSNATPLTACMAGQYLSLPE